MLLSSNKQINKENGEKLMRKTIIISILAISFLFLFMQARSLQAGTMMIGAKAWYAEWDSAVAKALGEYLVVALDDYYGITMDATISPGRGFLLGPLIGYLTDDNKWSFSAAFMLLSTFKQMSTFEGTGLYEGVDMDVTTGLNRMDFDASASYLLSNYFKVIAGVKLLIASYDVNFKIEGYPEEDFVEVDSRSYMPTVGLALAYPVFQNLVVGVQGGLLYIISDYYSKTDKEDIDTDNSFGFNVEPNLSYLLMEHFMIQFGIRYQVYSIKFTDPDLGVTKNDRFLGATLSAIYLW
jgi:hypothetical protein